MSTKKKRNNVPSKMEENYARMQRATYWITFILFLFITLIISISILPILIIFSGFFLNILVFVIGLSFGGLLSNLITHLDKLESYHHILAGISIPLAAIFSLILSFKIASLFKLMFFLPQDISLLTPLIYAIGFLLPYVYQLIYFKKLKYKVN